MNNETKYYADLTLTPAQTAKLDNVIGPEERRAVRPLTLEGKLDIKVEGSVANLAAVRRDGPDRGRGRGHVGLQGAALRG